MRITSRGIGLLPAAAALLATGFWLGYPELVVIGTATVVALVFAVGYVAWRPRLSVVRTVDPDRVMRGEASQVTLTVANASRFRAATLVAYDRCGPDTIGVPLLRLRAGKTTTVGYPVPTHRRGVVGVGPLQVVRRDPLGLVTMPRTHGGVDRVLVYPTVHPLTAIPTGIARSLDGLIDRVPHGSITFDNLREYVVGDELRHVHWRTTARIGELMVREHVDTSLPRLVVLLDDRASAYPPPTGPGVALCEAFEAACEAAASIVAAAARAELPLALALTSGLTVDAGGPASGAGGLATGAGGLATGAGGVATGAGGVATGVRRRNGARPYLDALAEAQLTPDAAADPLRTATSRLRHHRLGDTLIFLTGPGREADLALIGALRGRYPTLVVGMLGAADSTPPAMDGVLVLAATDGADFATAWDGVPAW